MSIDLVAGWTGRIEYQLKKDRVSVDLTGMTTCAVLKTKTGTVIATTCAGSVDIVTTTCGHIGFNPQSSGTFAAESSPYSLRFKVTDTAGATVFFPNAAAEVVTVRSQ